MQSTSLRLLVPIVAPQLESALVRFAAHLAATRSGVLCLTHIHPSSTPVAPHIQQAMLSLQEEAAALGVKSTVFLRSNDSVKDGIQAAAAELRCNMAIMGWYHEIEEEAIRQAVNSTVTKTTGLDTLIYLNRGMGDFKRIIVPTGGGSHSLMGLQLGYELAQKQAIPLEVLRVARDPRCSPDDPLLQRFCTQVYEDTQLQMNLLGVEAPITIIPAQEIVAPITSRIRDGDLVILGASNGWQSESSLAGPISDEIASRVPASVLLVRSGIDETYPLSSIFWERTIRLEFEASDKWQAIARLVDVLVEERQIIPQQRQTVIDAALGREEKSSTAMGHNTAIPHAPITGLPGIIGALGISRQGIEFGNNGEKVHFIYLLLTPQQNYRVYIPVLAQIAGLMRDHDQVEKVKACQTPQEVAALLKSLESTPPPPLAS
jgi:mannitol/fructose-specific phosphotransferase system IIA component (Ntr-type)/nucleotide-binding universal stress UspA family protein